jgi:hypothetical protein
LISALNVSKSKRETSQQSIPEISEVDNIKPAAIVIPISNKKQKYKMHVGMIAEKCIFT